MQWPALLVSSALLGSVAALDLFEFHLRNFLNFSESQCSNFYRHVCPESMFVNETVLYKTDQFYKDTEAQERALSLTNPITDDIFNGRTNINCTFDPDAYAIILQDRCAEDWNCYYAEFMQFFSVYKSTFSTVEDNLLFYSKHANASRSDLSLIQHVTAMMLQKLAQVGDLEASAKFFLGMQKRLSVMEALNQNDTSSAVGLSTIQRMASDLKAGILSKIRQTTWLTTVDSFGLDTLSQFEYYLNDLAIFTDFDSFDQNLTRIREINRNFSSAYFSAAKRTTGCLWLDVTLSLNTAQQMAMNHAKSHEEKALLLRIYSSFDFAAFNMFDSVILIAPTFFPLSANTTDQSFIGSTGYILAHEMYHTLVVSNYSKRASYYKEDARCVKAHFESTCQIFAEGEFCNSGEETFEEDATDLEGLREAHDILTQRFTVGQLAQLAFPDLPYSLEQIFFYAYATLWCTTDATDMEFQNDTHSLPIIRVNGVLSQMPEFTNAFNCFDGENMTADEESVCYLFGPNAVSYDVALPDGTQRQATTGRITTTTFSSINATDEFDALVEYFESGTTTTQRLPL